MQHSIIFNEFTKIHPDNHIVLLTGDRCIMHKDGVEITGKSKTYIDKINDHLSSVDMFIYTSVIGTGISIKHDNQRFTKCYGLFSGWVSSPMDAIQMLKRGRDVTEYVIGLLCRSSDLYMTSFYKDLGADALHKLSIYSDDIDTITAEMEFRKKQSSALFIPALLGLLRDKYKFKIMGQLSDETKIEGLQSVSKLREEYQRLLIAAIPHPNVKDAIALQMEEYKDDDACFSCEARICMDYYNMPTVTAEAAELWFNPTRKMACARFEVIIKLLRSEPDLRLKKPEMQRELLLVSGITLDLLTSRRLTHDEIIGLRSTIAQYCSELVGLGFLPECYVKPSKISTAKPIIPIKKILEYIGLNVTTKRAGKDRWLEISVPSPMVMRLKLDLKPTEEEKHHVLKEIALSMRAEGKGWQSIATALNLKNKDQARRLLK